MKLKEVVAMLNEYAKVVGEDCETDISEIRVIGSVMPTFSEYLGYRNRETGPRYYIRIQPDQPVVQMTDPSVFPAQPA